MNKKKLIRVEDFAYPAYKQKKKIPLLKVINLSAFYKRISRKRMCHFSKSYCFKTSRFFTAVKSREQRSAPIELYNPFLKVIVSNRSSFLDNRLLIDRGRIICCAQGARTCIYTVKAVSKQSTFPLGGKISMQKYPFSYSLYNLLYGSTSLHTFFQEGQVSSCTHLRFLVPHIDECSTSQIQAFATRKILCTNQKEVSRALAFHALTDRRSVSAREASLCFLKCLDAHTNYREAFCFSEQKIASATQNTAKPFKEICHFLLFFTLSYLKQTSIFMLSFTGSNVKRVYIKIRKKIDRLSHSLCTCQKCDRDVGRQRGYFFTSLTKLDSKSYRFKGSSIFNFCRNSQRGLRGFSSHRAVAWRRLLCAEREPMHSQKQERPDIFWYLTYKRSYTIVRPLLTFLRCTVTIACRETRLPIYPDLSNLEIKYSRNRIRKQIIPTMKFLLNPKMEKALFQFSELLR